MIIKSIIRSIRKQGLLSTSKILSLVVAFSVVLFLLHKINHEESYDRFWDEQESIYRVAISFTNGGETTHSAKNFSGASHLLKKEIPAVAEQCNLARDIVSAFYNDNKVQDVKWFWSDPTVFSVLPRQIIASTGIDPLSDIHGIAVSESFAKRIFGEEDPLNKEISINEGWKFIINTVFEDFPANSHLDVDVLSSNKSVRYYYQNFDNAKRVLVDNPDFRFPPVDPYSSGRWWRPLEYGSYSYIKLQKNASIDQVKLAYEVALQKVDLPSHHKESEIEFIFQPIADIHLHSQMDHEAGTNGSSMQVRFLYLIGIVVLVVSQLNVLNLSSISAIERRKTFAVQLITGSKRKDILISLLFESLILHLISLTFAIPILMLTMKFFSPELIVSLGAVVVIIIIGCIGAILSAFVPFLTLFGNGLIVSCKSQIDGISGRKTGKNGLVVFQFGIAIILIIATLGIFKQVNFMMEKELGFEADQTIYSYTPMSMIKHPEEFSRMATLRNKVETLAGVSDFSVSSTIPGKPYRRIAEVALKNQSENLHTLNVFSSDDKFLDAYNIDLIFGEGFEKQGNRITNHVLLNEKALQILRVDKPDEIIGKTIFSNGQPCIVKGVIGDYHQVSLRGEIKPLMITQNLNWDHGVGYFSFKLSTGNLQNTIADIETIWNGLYSGEELIYYFSDATFQEQYMADQSFSKILSISSGISLLISCLGLLSLAFYNCKQRIKEIGVRKVNGASIVELLFMLNTDFLKWVVIAFVVACPVANILLAKWLNSFAYKTNVSWWIYLAAGGFALFIAFATVTFQSWKTARRNPVEALRYE